MGRPRTILDRKAYNKEYLKKYEAMRKSIDPEYRKEYFKQYKIKNKEAIKIKTKLQNKRYKATHRDEIRNSVRKYRRKTKRYIVWNNNRRYRMTNAGILTKKDVQQVYENNIKKHGTLTCYLCLSPIVFGNDHLEHKTPLCRGGTHHIDNLEVACASCNCKKNTKTLEEFKGVGS
jgi:5-methylcytosine-specific restriction endonuclease McrA